MSKTSQQLNSKKKSVDSGWCLYSKSGREYRMNVDGGTSLGRRNCKITLGSRSVEKQHALIDYDFHAGKFRLKDLATKHGTFLNDERLEADKSVLLDHNDNLRFGLDPTSYRVVRMNSEDSLNQEKSNSSTESSGNKQKIFESDRNLVKSMESMDTVIQQGPDLQESPRNSGNTPPPPANVISKERGVSAEELFQQAASAAEESGNFYNQQFNRVLPPVIVSGSSSSGNMVRIMGQQDISAGQNPIGQQLNQQAQNVVPQGGSVLFHSAQHQQQNISSQAQVPYPIATGLYQPVFVPSGFYYANPGTMAPHGPGPTYIINAAAQPPPFCPHHRQLTAPMPACPHCLSGQTPATAPPALIQEGHPSPPLSVRTVSEPSRPTSASSAPVLVSTPPHDPAAREEETGKEHLEEGGVSPRNKFENQQNVNDYGDGRGTQRYHTGAKMEKDHGRTPIFGHTPAWWGGSETDQEDPSSESVVRRRQEFPIRKQVSCVSDTEALNQREIVSASPPLASDQRPLSCREAPVKMIIPFDGEDNTKKIARKPRNESTAFTIEFTGDSTSTKITALTKHTVPPETDSEENQRTPRSSSEWPQKHFNRGKPGRRSAGAVGHQKPPAPPPRGRKSAGATTTSAETPEHLRAATDPKEYLLKKLLSGDPDGVDAQESSTVTTLAPRTPRKDSDAISDAGTYVVDRAAELVEEEKLLARQEEQARENIDKVFGLNSKENEEDEGSGSRTPTPPPVPDPPQKLAPAPVPAPKGKEEYFRRLSKPPLRGQQVTRQAVNKEEEKARKGLLKQLLRITQEEQNKMQEKKVVEAPEREKETVGNAPFHRQCTTRKQQPNAPALGASNSQQQSFRRADGGRFSMRTPTGPKKTTPSQKTPQQAQAAAKNTEMAAWLRRKQYNPLKSASSAGKKAENLAESEPEYLTNRSRSFHVGTLTEEVKMGGKLNLSSKKRSLNSSEDNLRVEEEEEEGRRRVSASENLVADFSRNIAQQLLQMSAKEGEQKGAVKCRDLEAVLDQENYSKLRLLSDQLGLRTKRALDIIQSQRISSSMEQLVSGASALSEPESPMKSHGSSEKLTIESLLNQMQQASEAFNAVNRYLAEVCSNGSVGSDSGKDCGSLHTF